jgi:hypothetical protein
VLLEVFEELKVIRVLDQDLADIAYQGKPLS